MGDSSYTDRIFGFETSTAIKQPCRAASTANVAFIGTAPFGYQTIDGIAVTDNSSTPGAAPDRVLLKNQTDSTQNGIWIVRASAWQRAPDFDGTRDVVHGTIVTVVEGSVNANTSYYVTTTDNPIVIGTSPITFAFFIGSPFFNFVTPEMFGAAGDDVTDDTAAVQRALDTGLPVKIQAKYLTTGSLLPSSSQTIFADSYGQWIRCTANNANTLALLGVSNVKVYNLFLKNQGSYNSGLNGAAVYIAVGANSNTVDGCRLEGNGAGVTLSSDDNRITNNTVTTTGATDCQWDIGVFNSGSNNIITGNRCYGDQCRIGILVQANLAPINKPLIANNIVYNKGAYGILLYSGSLVNVVTNGVVTGNIVDHITGIYNNLGNWAVVAGDNPFGAGIYIQTADFTTCTGNVLSNTNLNTNVDTLAPGAIGCSGTSVVAISGNTIVSPTWHGITVNSGYSVGLSLGGATISGNTIRSPGQMGIRIKDQENVSCTGNVIFDPTGQGIFVDGDLATRKGVVISANIISGGSDNGIDINKMKAINVVGNKVIACARALSFGSCVDGLIIGNEFRDSTGTNDVQVDNSNSGNIQFDKNIVKSSAATGVSDGVGMRYGTNDVSGQTTLYSANTAIERLLATTATPGVDNAGMCVASASGTAITDLTGGYAGQIITVRATGNRTVKHAGGAGTTQVILNGAVDFAMVNNNTLTLQYLLGGPWFELARKA